MVPIEAVLFEEAEGMPETPPYDTLAELVTGV